MFSEKVLLRLKNAYNVTAITGAGISVDSGVPTFRGADGLWNNHKVEEIATLDGFEKNTETFWEFYHWRRKQMANIKPNLGHYALVDIENYFEDFNLITQNTDNLHAVAGSTKFIELHGNITRNRCSGCDAVTVVINSDAAKIPKCSKCGAALKPDVVLFGEELNKKALSRAQEVSAVCEVFISIGTSALVEPAASLPYIAKGNGAYLLEINTERTELSDNCDEVIIAPASKLLPTLVMILDRIR